MKRCHERAQKRRELIGLGHQDYIDGLSRTYRQGHVPRLNLRHVQQGWDEAEVLAQEEQKHEEEKQKQEEFRAEVFGYLKEHLRIEVTRESQLFGPRVRLLLEGKTIDEEELR